MSDHCKIVCELVGEALTSLADARLTQPVGTCSVPSVNSYHGEGQELTTSSRNSILPGQTSRGILISLKILSLENLLKTFKIGRTIWWEKFWDLKVLWLDDI